MVSVLRLNLNLTCPDSSLQVKRCIYMNFADQERTLKAKFERFAPNHRVAYLFDKPVGEQLTYLTVKFFKIIH